MNEPAGYFLYRDFGTSLGFQRTARVVRTVHQAEVDANMTLTPNTPDGVYFLSPRDPITKRIMRQLYRLTKTDRTVVREVRTPDGGWRYDCTFKI